MAPGVCTGGGCFYEIDNGWVDSAEPDDRTGDLRASLACISISLRCLEKGVSECTPRYRYFRNRLGQDIRFCANIGNNFEGVRAVGQRLAIRPWSPWWRADNPQPQDVSSMRSVEPAARLKAVRALILYPMNALVEDQLVRLRKALDSDRRAPCA